MKVQSFEDLIAWQKARDLTKQIYESVAQPYKTNNFVIPA